MSIVAESIKAATPHLLGVREGDPMPMPEPEAATGVLGMWRERGIPEFYLLVAAAVLFLNFFSIITKGRLFPRLDYEKQASLMERLFRSKSRVLGRVLFFLSTPAVTAYYSRVDVQVLLGFDIPALKEEAEKRHVTRNGAPLPEKEEAPPKHKPSQEGVEQ